jgi:hypothetical protein
VIVPGRNLFLAYATDKLPPLLLAVLKRFEEERPESGGHVQLIGENESLNRPRPELDRGLCAPKEAAPRLSRHHSHADDVRLWHKAEI